MTDPKLLNPDPDKTCIVESASLLQNLDFSGLTMDTRREPRFTYRGSLLAAGPSGHKQCRVDCIDVSQTGLSFTSVLPNFKVGQDIYVEFFGAGAPAVRGVFKVANCRSESKDGQNCFRIGLTLKELTKASERPYAIFLGQLQEQSGFNFSDAR